MMAGTINPLSQFINSKDADGLNNALKELKYTEDQLMEAFKCAVGTGATDCVRVIVQQQHIDISFKISYPDNSSTMTSLAGFISQDDGPALKAYLRKNSCSVENLIQALFEAGQKQAYKCLEALVMHEKVPVDVRNDDKSILSLILEPYATRSEESVSNEDKIVQLVHDICQKLVLNHAENIVQDESLQDMAKDENDILGADSLEDFSQFENFHHCILEGFAQKGSPLVLAVESGNCQLVESLLDYRQRVIDRPLLDDFDVENEPLMAALEKRNVPIVKTLMQSATVFSSLNCVLWDPDPWEVSLARYFTEGPFSDSDRMELLCMMASESNDNNPLTHDDVYLLFQRGDNECISAFLSSNKDFSPYTAKPSLVKKQQLCLEEIFGSALLGKEENLQDFLKKVDIHKINLNATVSSLWKLPHCFQNSTAELQIMYDFYPYNKELTPLQTVLRLGKPEYLAPLLGAGVDTNVSEPHRFPPICHIMEYVEPGGITCYKQILRYGCNLDAMFSIQKRNKSNIKVSLLDFFIICSNMFVCEMLWKVGATKLNPNIDRFKFDKFFLLHDAPLEDQITDEEIHKFRSSVFVKQWSLAHIARKAFRNAIGKDIERKVNQMELPKHVKNFINLEELDGLEEQYARYKTRYHFRSYAHF